jgi:hypothetical protein
VVVTLAPHADGIEASDEREVVPVVNPITVSMALCVAFLVALLAVVAVRPTDAHDLRAADEGRPAEAATVRYGGPLPGD